MKQIDRRVYSFPPYVYSQFLSTDFEFFQPFKSLEHDAVARARKYYKVVPTFAIRKRIQQTEGKRIDAASVLGRETRTINTYSHFYSFTYLSIGAGGGVNGEQISRLLVGGGADVPDIRG